MMSLALRKLPWKSCKVTDQPVLKVQLRTSLATTCSSNSRCNHVLHTTLSHRQPLNMWSRMTLTLPHQLKVDQGQYLPTTHAQGAFEDDTHQRLFHIKPLHSKRTAPQLTPENNKFWSTKKLSCVGWCNYFIFASPNLITFEYCGFFAMITSVTMFILAASRRN